MLINLFTGNIDRGFFPCQDKAVRLNEEGFEFEDLGVIFKHEVIDNKKKRWMFSFWEYCDVEDVIDPEDGYSYFDGVEYARATADNATRVHAIVLDIDGSKDKAAPRISQMVSRISEYNYLLYTTHSHTDDEHSYRIIIPLVEPVAKQDWYDRTKALKSRFLGVDKTSFDVSRLFYLPSHAEGAPAKRFFITDRENFDVMALPTNDECTGAYEAIRVIKKRKVVDTGEVTREDIDRVLAKLKGVKVTYEPIWFKVGSAMYALGCEAYEYVEVTSFIMNEKSAKDAMDKWKRITKKGTHINKKVAIGYLGNIINGTHHR